GCVPVVSFGVCEGEYGGGAVGAVDCAAATPPASRPPAINTADTEFRIVRDLMGKLLGIVEPMTPQALCLHRAPPVAIADEDYAGRIALPDLPPRARTPSHAGTSSCGCIPWRTGMAFAYVARRHIRRSRNRIIKRTRR